MTTDTTARVQGVESHDEVQDQPSQSERPESPNKQVSQTAPSAPAAFVAKAETEASSQTHLSTSLLRGLVAAAPIDPSQLSKFLAETEHLKAATPKPKPDEPETEPLLTDNQEYHALAEQAARAGHFALAYQLQCASLLAGESDIQSQVRYSDVLRRPIWRIRFGVSLSVQGDSEFGPQPIRDSLGTSRPRRAVRNAGSASKDAPELTRGTPELASESQASERAGEKPAGAQVATSVGEIAPRLESHLGLVASLVGQTLVEHAAVGDYGPFNALALQRRSGGRESLGEESPIKPLVDAFGEAAEEWYPGVRWVDSSSGDDSMILSEARRMNVDLLIDFEVYLKAVQGETRNLARCRVVDVATGKTLASSRGIDSRDANKPVPPFNRANPRSYVEKQLQPVLHLLGERLQTRNLPPLTPEIVHRQIRQLLAKRNAASLESVALIELYRKLGQISEPQADHACQILGGETGHESSTSSLAASPHRGLDFIFR